VRLRGGWRLAALAMAGIGMAGAALAEGDAPMRLIVPFPAGGTSDSLARLLAKGLAERIKRPVVVENRAGAGTVIGTDAVAKSAPDANTLLLTSNAVAINVYLHKSLPYDTQADLDEVVTVAEMPMAIYAAPMSRLKTLGGMLGAAKAQPGRLNYGTAGIGSTGHLTMKLVEQASATHFNHVPFQGSAPSINALMGGHTDLALDTVFLGAPQVRAGKLVAVATLGQARSKLLPDVPTAAEAGLPGFSSSAWFGISVRRGTPAALLEALNRTLNQVLADPPLRESLERDGFQIIGGTRQDAQARFMTELDKMKSAVRLSGEVPQ
jgi:tripartite-type tricarboxylate transporter receptor subunit TctC